MEIGLERLTVHLGCRLIKERDDVLHPESLIKEGLKPGLVVHIFQEGHKEEIHKRTGKVSSDICIYRTVAVQSA